MTDDPIEKTWQEVLADFEDAAVHKRFLMLCAGLDRLEEAGRRYRAIKEDPGDPRAPMAERQVEQLLALAMQRLEPLKTPPSRRRGIKTIVFLVALGVSSALVLVSLWSWLRSM